MSLYSIKKASLELLKQKGILTEDEYYKCLFALTDESIHVIYEDGEPFIFIDIDPNELEYDEDDDVDDDDEEEEAAVPEPVFVKINDIAYEDENIRLIYRGIKEDIYLNRYDFMLFCFIVENLSPYSVSINDCSIELNGFEVDDNAALVFNLGGRKKTVADLSVAAYRLQDFDIYSYLDLQSIQIAFRYKIKDLGIKKETVQNEYEIKLMK